MKYIELSQNKKAIVDDEDFDWLSQWKWYYKHQLGGGYATRNSETKPRTTIRMHRQIMDTPIGFETDHINHEKLDNRQSNLRVCTKSQNQLNRKKQNSKSKYKGVTWRPREEHWVAQIQIDNKKVYLGYFLKEEDAALAYWLSTQEMLAVDNLTHSALPAM